MKYSEEKRNFKVRPYISAEVAFLGFIEDFHKFNTNTPHKAFLRNGPKDPESGLRPREVLGIAIMANVAMFLSGDKWVQVISLIVGAGSSQRMSRMTV